MKRNLIKWLLPAVVVFSACSKDDVAPSPPVTQPAKGVYVLSEGSSNNSKLSFYSIANANVIGDFFLQQNPGTSGLGDIANDMLIYGSKLYIVVNNSNLVKVLNASDAKFIQNISFGAPGVNKLPRSAASAKGKVFVTAWDGTVSVIDTTSLSIIKTITVGLNPEGIVVSGDNLYVANSGGLTTTFDSTISIINLTSLTETGKINVGLNPYGIGADNLGNVYVSCIGNYADRGPKLVKVNTASNTVTKSADTAIGSFRFYDGKLFVTGGYLGVAKVRTLNTQDFTATSANFITDGTTIQNPYGITVNEENGDVYVTDAKNYISAGEVFCFDKTGKKKFSFSTSPGISPNKIVFIR